MILHSFFDKLRYLLKRYTHKKYFKKITSFIKINNKIFLTILIIAMLVDIFLFKQSSDFIIFGFLFFYSVLVKIVRIKSRSTFLFCLVLLGVMCVDFIVTGTSASTEKVAVWFILFLGFGIIHQWRELKN